MVCAEDVVPIVAMPISLLVPAIPTASGMVSKGAFPHDAILEPVAQSTQFDVATVQAVPQERLPEP